MPRHTHDDLLRALGRGELAPVYYLFGSEDILKEEASRAILERALEPHERDFNLDQRSAQGLDPEELHALVNTLPMMATRRVVVIRDIEVWKKKTGSARCCNGIWRTRRTTPCWCWSKERRPRRSRRDWEPDEAIASRVLRGQL